MYIYPDEREKLALFFHSERGLLAWEGVVDDYISRLTEATRNHEAAEVGVSPRGALFIDRMAKARAFSEGRDYVVGADVQAVFKDVCAHRVLLREDAGEKSVTKILDGVLAKTENPDRRGLFPGIRRR